MNDNNAYTITIGDSSSLDTTFTFDTYSTNDTSINLVDTNHSDVYILDNLVDPERVVKMSEHYPALAKAWENFYSIYQMVDQDYKGNYENNDEIPF